MGKGQITQSDHSRPRKALSVVPAAETGATLALHECAIQFVPVARLFISRGEQRRRQPKLSTRPSITCLECEKIDGERTKQNSTKAIADTMEQFQQLQRTPMYFRRFCEASQANCNVKQTRALSSSCVLLSRRDSKLRHCPDLDGLTTGFLPCDRQLLSNPGMTTSDICCRDPTKKETANFSRIRTRREKAERILQIERDRKENAWDGNHQ